MTNQEALDICNGNRAAAARMLNLPENTFKYRLNKYPDAPANDAGFYLRKKREGLIKAHSSEKEFINRGMRVLIWDIETSPLIFWGWRCGEQYIRPDQIIDDWWMLMASFKWHGDKEVQNIKCTDYGNFRDDKPLIKELHNVLSQADVLVAHNGDKFDLKKFNSRCVYHGLEPLPRIKTVDTLRVARSRFGFTSNKLDYISKHLGFCGKIENEKCLFLKAWNGDKKAFEDMAKYCNQDVLILEEVYDALAPFHQTHPNRNLFTSEKVCPVCGSMDNKKEGTYETRVTRREQYRCTSCGHCYIGKKSLKNVEYR